MPKQKTCSGAKKRFKVTASGLIVRRRANKGHLLTKKTRKRKKRLGRPAIVKGSDRKAISRLVPYL